jgi:tetratricopeptide (TPR) repeat protein
MNRWFNNIAICFLIIGSSSMALGEDTVQRRADELFTRGQILFESKDYVGAAEAFNLAYQTSPHPAVLANLALSYDRAGKVTKAVEAYRSYLSSPISTEKNEEMQQRLDELEKEIADLSLACEPRPCAISIDRLSRGSSPLDVVLLPGQHQIEVFVAKKSIQQKSLALEAKAKKRLVFSTKPQETTPTEDKPPQLPPTTVIENEETDATLRAPFWVFTGITVAAGATTIVLGIQTLNQSEIYKDSGNLDADAKEQGENYRLATNIMIGVTAASAATALVFLIYDLKRSRKKTVSFYPSPGLGLIINASF